MKNWEDLRFLLAIADAGSLSGAARHLQVDHATVSRRLNALEENLKTRLVIRAARSCHLTVLGQQVLEIARQMEATAFTIDRLALAAQHPISGNVSISAPPVLATHLLAKCLNKFHQCHPQIQLSIASQAARISLSRQEADIALRLVRPADNNDVARKLGNMPFALYASKDYVHQSDPDSWKFIGYDKQFSGMPHAGWITSTAGIRPIVCSVSDISSQLEAAKSGVGVASLPRFMGDSDPELVSLPFDGEIYSPEIWLAIHADLRHSPLMRIVLDFIANAVTEHIVT